MRILYHHRTQAEDAQGIHIYEMVRAFRDLGHEVELVALVDLDQSQEEKVRGGGWQWLTRWAPNWLYEVMSFTYNLYGYRCLCRAIRLKKPDFIYERYALNTFCGLWASRRFQIPLILEVNAPLYHEQNSLGRLTFRRSARFAERWICSHSTWTIVVSRVLKGLLAQEGVPDEKMVVMPNGIDPLKFHRHVSGETVRRRYGLEGQLVIGFVGWFRKWHGIEMLLESMREVLLTRQGVRLLLVGDGPAYPELYQYVKTYGLQSVVVFTGPVERQAIAAHIAAMDIAVQPSATGYACPMKIMEYMGMGKCIVAPDQPNIREILEDRVSGFLFHPEDKESLRATLRELLDSPSKREAAGQKAYESILERGLLWHANAQKTLALVLEEKVRHAGSGNEDASKTERTAPMSAMQETA